MAKSRRGQHGERLLDTVDLFEVTLTPRPMHPEARVLSWEAAGDTVDRIAELRARIASFGC